MMDVVIVGMEGGFQDNITMIHEGVTKGGNLCNYGHEEENTYHNSDLREKVSRKKQQKEDTQKIHEKEQQIENKYTSNTDVHKRKQNKDSETKMSLSSYSSEKKMGNSVIKGNVENTPRGKNKPRKQKRDAAKRRLNKQPETVQEN